MVHENLQEAIAQLSTEDNMDSEEVKNRYNLSMEDISAIQSSESNVQTAPKRYPGLCSCCCV